MESPSGPNIKRAKKALSFIVLHCKSGPTLHIQYEEYSKGAQEKLEALYKPQGFTLEFLLCNEFFNAKPENSKGLEDYLINIKRLTDKLKSRNLGLPSQIIISQILSNLGEEFEGFVSNITQALRKEPSAYNYDTLTSAILDEVKRHNYKNQVNNALSRLKGQNKGQNKGLNKGLNKGPNKGFKGRILKKL